MSDYKFSGHDTFHCRQQWLLKGVKLIDNEGYNVLNKPDIAISKLGVGKNMVQSIQHWLKAFDLINENHEIKDFTEKMFLGECPFDPYLEDEATLWLLQYKICKTKYASIFNLIFSDYFNDKISSEFSESQIIQFIEKKLRDANEREVSRNTLASDFKSFIRSYASPVKTLKTIEDDFNAPLLELNLISQLSAKNSFGETVYKLNKDAKHNVPTEIFAYCLLDLLEERQDISYDEIRKTLGSYFCLSNDVLDDTITRMCTTFSEFVYKSDAGIRQIQIKGITEKLKANLLTTYYEL